MVTETQRFYNLLENDNKYSIDQYKYPEFVGDPNQGLGHFVMFHINETVGSKLSAPENSERVENEYLAEDLRERLNSPVGALDNLADIPWVGDLQSTTKRLKSSIALTMPENIITAYQTSWEAEDVQAAVALGGIANSIGDAMNNFDGAAFSEIAKAGDFKSAMFAALDSAGLDRQNAGDVTQAFLQGTEFSNAVSVFRRELRNPYREFLFNGVEPRRFELTFKFNPKSRQDTESIQQIIKLFKYHSMPSKTRDDNVFGVFYEYPSEFDIQFYSGANQNQYLFKFSTCACTNVTVDYTPERQWSSFEINEKGGAPTSIVLTLAFAELEFLTRERIEEGF